MYVYSEQIASHVREVREVDHLQLHGVEELLGRMCMYIYIYIYIYVYIQRERERDI